MDCFEKAKYTRAIKGLEKYKELIKESLSENDLDYFDKLIKKLKETRDFEEKQKCAADDCERLFVPYKPGCGQRFCSPRCRLRTHIKNKKIKQSMN